MALKRESGRKKTLSKSILEMKFMQKSKEAAWKEAEAEEGRVACGGKLTEAMRLGGARTVLEPSFVPCEDLVSPRQSFHGANPEVERLLGTEQPDAIKMDADAEVTAEEVARVTHAGKKLQPPRKKAKFLKPPDDDDDY